METNTERQTANLSNEALRALSAQGLRGLADAHAARQLLQDEVAKLIATNNDPSEIHDQTIRVSKILEPLLRPEVLAQAKDGFPKDLQVQMVRLYEALQNQETASNLAPGLPPGELNFRRERLFSEARTLLILNRPF